jgi:uncharacterized membrane protein
MVGVLVGVVSAVLFGAADFLGGMASRRIPALRATAIAGATGFVLFLVALPLVGGSLSPSAAFWGVVSGVSGVIAIVLLYACLAVGPMSILSPLTALCAAIVPMTVGIATGDQLSPLDYWALGIALIAVVLVGYVPDKDAVRPAPRTLLMAVASGIMMGVFLVAMDMTPENSGLVPLVFNRAANAVTVFSIVAILAYLRWRRTGASSLLSGWRPGLVLALACGAVDALANAGILLALRLGELAITSVLVALYPIGTIILAAGVLRERIAAVQYAGLALALAAVAMLAIG